MSTKKPKRLALAAAYLHAPEQRQQITPKIPMGLKLEMDEAVVRLTSKLDQPVSANSFVESAIRWYLDALKREGTL